ncbi:MAG: glycosyl transferase, partial [Deltaproteobacteria bacterium]|nr:glycosyl transferase [Deltaproteobacteria bacterium]
MQPELTRDNMRSSINNIAYPAFFFIVTILTRLPFTSRLLYHWDSVQFALGLEDYDITVHQPHPPGYFLYVMLGRLVYFFIRDANYALIIISI